VTDDKMWAYVAGFVDGEGCIRIAQGTNHISPSITVGQTERQAGVLYVIQEFLKRQGIASYINKAHWAHRIRGTQPSLNLRVAKRVDVEKCLRLLLPYLIVKKLAAQDVLRFCTMYPRLNSSKLHHLLYPAVRAKETCRNGRPWTEENTIWYPEGGRTCRICRKATRHAYYEKLRQAKVA